MIILENENHHHYAKFYREMCNFLDNNYGNDVQDGIGEWDQCLGVTEDDEVLLYEVFCCIVFLSFMSCSAFLWVMVGVIMHYSFDWFILLFDISWQCF